MKPLRRNRSDADEVRSELGRRFRNGKSPAASAEPAKWDSRHRGRTIGIAVAIVMALALIVPASVHAFALAARPHPAGESQAVQPPSTSRPAQVLPLETRVPPLTSTSIPTSAPTTGSATGPGCPATSASMPKGALDARIDDVDGDGRPDTEWAVQHQGGTLQFGITTASGATISGRQGFAGGGDRMFVVGTLANGVVVAITSEGRDSPVYTFSDCTFHTLLGEDLLPDPTPTSGFTFYSEDGGGSGGCFDGRLAIVTLITATSAPSETYAVARWVDVSFHGSTATLTKETGIVAKHPDPQKDLSRYDTYAGISCGASPVLRPVHRAG